VRGVNRFSVDFSLDFEVTSTVNIKTPDDNPVVWQGVINMPDVAKFSVNAFQVRHHYLFLC
jgi:hypothetical protein